MRHLFSVYLERYFLAFDPALSSNSLGVSHSFPRLIHFPLEPVSYLQAYSRAVVDLHLKREEALKLLFWTKTTKLILVFRKHNKTYLTFITDPNLIVAVVKVVDPLLPPLDPAPESESSSESVSESLLVSLTPSVVSAVRPPKPPPAAATVVVTADGALDAAPADISAAVTEVEEVDEDDVILSVPQRRFYII